MKDTEYRKERGKDRERDRKIRDVREREKLVFYSLTTPQMETTARSGLDSNQEPRIQFQSPTWVAGTQVLRLSLTAFPGTSAASGIKSGVTKTPTGTHV